MLSRRKFLQSSLALATTIPLCGCLPTISYDDRNIKYVVDHMDFDPWVKPSNRRVYICNGFSEAYCKFEDGSEEWLFFRVRSIHPYIYPAEHNSHKKYESIMRDKMTFIWRKAFREHTHVPAFFDGGDESYSTEHSKTGFTYPRVVKINRIVDWKSKSTIIYRQHVSPLPMSVRM